MIKDSNQLEKLLASFRSAEQRVNKVLFQTNPKTVQQLKISLDRELKTVTLQLSESAKKWVNSDLKTAYNEGANKVGNLPYGKTDGGIKQDAILNPYIELSESISKATEQTRQTVNNIINKSLNNGTTSVYEVKKALQEEMFKQNGSMVVKYSNGANMPLSAYSSMVARTARIEASNTGSLNRCQSMNYDLVKCTIVPNCCPYCKRFEGKVYSISGKDNRFPYLYDSANGPFQNGYNIMHPNCRHEFLPYIEQLQTAEQLNKDVKNSVVLEEQPKTKKIFDTYNSQQKKLRQYREEFKEYKELKSKLGSEFPYQSLGSFRRARRANSQTYRQIFSLPAKQQRKADNEDVLIPKRKKFIPATTKIEAEEFAKNTLGIKTVDYGNNNIETINEWNKGLYETFQDIPELKEKFTFVGDARKRNKCIKTAYEEDVWKLYREKYGNDYSDSYLERYVKISVNRYMKSLSVSKDTFAVSSAGYKNIGCGVCVNDDYGKNPTLFNESLKRTVETSFHPIGCDTIKSVIDHELGHQIDTMLQISKNSDIIELFKKMPKSEITEKLSRYAWNNSNPNPIREFVAEAYAEYKNNENPREIAKTVGELIAKEYKEWKKKNS